MCGIVGINWEDKKIVQKMMKKVAHRGPDQSGYYLTKGISLGHQRLSIVDLSERGKQPMFNEDGDICLVFNGEVYNHNDIRKELPRHTFTSNTDTEVIVHAYEEWNVSAISRLNGMFAFALYDEQKKMLVLARDRIGIKPLYYYWKDGKLVFASEIKAIFEAGVPRNLRKESVGDVLQYGFVPSPCTMWEDIYKLPPGHYATLRDEQLELRKYWDVTFQEGGGDEDYYALSFRAVLKQSVKQQLMSDVPYGAYLSGGLDSSSIVAFMASIVKAPVKTFSVGFDSDDVVNEPGYARLVAEHFSTDHQEVIVSSDHVLKVLPTLAYHLDDPIGNAASVPLYYLAKEAKKKVTVVLTGNGSDELFGGYRQHKVVSRVGELTKKLPFLQNNLVLSTLQKSSYFLPRKLARYASFGATYLLIAGKPELAYTKLMYKTFPDEAIADLDIPHQPANERIAPIFASSDTTVNQLIKLDTKFLLAENYLMVDDKINMIHAVESRVPYLDNMMLEFAGNLPTRFKVNGFTGKYIVRKAMKGILPYTIINRQKYGFTPPIRKWSDDILIKHCDSLFDKNVCKSIGISHDKVLKLFSVHESERRNRAFPLALLGEWAKQQL